MEINEQIVESARLAWNIIDSIFEEEPSSFESDSTEFKLFYDQLIGHLLEEETEA